MHLDRQVVSFWGFAKHESILLLFILYYSTTERIFKASNTSELTFLKLPCWLAVVCQWPFRLDSFFITASPRSRSTETYENYYVSVPLSPKTRIIYLYLSFAENKCWGTEPYMAAAHNNERFCSCCKAFKNKML